MNGELLYKTNKQLLDIIDFLPDPTLVIDRNKKVIAWNRALEEMTGVSKADIIGKGDYSYAIPFYGEARPILVDLIFSNDLSTELKYINVMREGKTICGEVYVKLPFNKKEVFIWIKASPLSDSDGNLVGAIASARDITKHKREEEEIKRYRDHLEELVDKRTMELKTANEQLQQEIIRRKQVEYTLREIEELYCQLVENSPDVILLHSKERLDFINKAGAKLFGMDNPREAVGTTMINLIHPEYQEVVAKKWRLVQDERKIAPLTEEKIVRLDGKVLDIEVVTAPCTIQGEPKMQAVVRDITERKRAEKMLRLSEEKFSKAFNAVPNPMVISSIEDGQIIDVNDHFLSFFGYTRQEVLNHIVSDFYMYENTENCAKVVHYIANQGFVKNLEINFRNKSGEIRNCLFSADTVAIGGKQYLLSVISDITELKQVEKALRLSEERFQKAFYNNPNPMVIVRHRDDQHIDVNKSFERFFGFSREEIIGRTVFDINLYKDFKEFKLFKKILQEKGYVHNLDVLFKTKKGDIRNILESCEIIELNKEKCRLVALNDITDFKKMENKMVRLERLNLIGQMAAGIGHEIRNPMTTVRGFLQMYRKKDSFVQYKDNFDLMIDELDRANSIITEFLSLARNKPVDLKWLNINLLLEKLLPMMQANAFNDDKYIEVELTEINDLFLDENDIIQLILNLVRNGFEAMTSGKKLTIKTFLDSNQVVLAVQDQGSGIKPEVLDKIGTPFFTTKDNGTGLGLSVCYSIVERNNATLEIKTGCSGTTIFVRFGTGKKLVHGIELD
ncbi:MAG: PAS domain S-box protein [Desulfotomaculaceae bacterium]|nr:PAS domain S-box protein [Desulfotomaculaceae bacterium]